MKELEREIQCVLGQIDADASDRVVVNFMDRVISCMASSKGGHMPDLVFHV